MLSKFARTATANKTEKHGGKRYNGTFFNGMQVAMDQKSIKATTDYECICETHCMWKALNA